MWTLSAALSPSLPSIYQHWRLLRNGNVGNKRLICLFNLLNGATRLTQFQSKCSGRVLKRNLPSSLLSILPTNCISDDDPEVYLDLPCFALYCVSETCIDSSESGCLAFDN